MTQTMINRLSRTFGIPFVSNTPTILSLPTGAFPFATTSAFGMFNVAASNEVAIEHFDPSTFALLGKTVIGTAPTNNCSSLDYTSTEIVTADDAANCVWYINPSTMTVSGSTILTGNGRDVVTAGSHIYAISDGAGEVYQIDPSTRSIVATLSVPNARHGCYDGFRYLWVSCFTNSQVAKIDLTTFTWVATYAVGSSPFGVEVDGDYVWTFNNGTTVGSVSRIRISDGAVTTVSMGSGNALHFGRRWRDKLFMADANGNGVIVFDVNSMTVVNWIPTGPNTIGIDILADGLHWACTCGNNNTVEIRPLETLW